MDSNTGKLIGAFAVGAVLATGMALLMRPSANQQPNAPAVEVAQAPTVTSVPSVSAEPEPEPKPAPLASRPAPRPASKPASKPSPSGPPVVAQSAPPPAAEPAPAPAPQPVPQAAPPPPPPAAQEDTRVFTPAPPPPKPPEPKSITIPEGTVLNIRLGEKISTETHRSGDHFSGTLAQPLIIEGLVIAEKNSRVSGKITQAVESGRVKGVAQLGLELTEFTTSDHQRINIQTAPFVKTAPTSRGNDAAKVGMGAAIGAAIGAIAGGGRGAAIGAGAGGAAGAGTVMATRGKAAELPVETRLTFRISNPVTITEKR